jgi:hypothetical protein
MLSQRSKVVKNENLIFFGEFEFEIIQLEGRDYDCFRIELLVLINVL